MPNPTPNPSPSPVPVAPVAPLPPAQQSPVPKNRMEPAARVTVRAGKQPVRHTGGIIAAGQEGEISERDFRALGKSVTRK